jgi:FKBP-type peptidyl-prolyl cis-trans isomerase FklB
MRKFLTASMIVLSSASVFAGTAITTQPQQLGYTFGATMGLGFKKDAIKLDPQSFLQGFNDAYTGGKLQLSKVQMHKVMTAFQKSHMKKVIASRAKLGTSNSKKGVAFLAANASKPGVKVLPSGVQYKILKAGTGAHPTAKSTVTINYQGQLINGSVFDSSYQRGKPASLSLAHVIPGWQQAVPHMKTGGTWMLYIPSQQAYGAQGIPGVIPPNATLIFKVQLLSVK